MIIDASAPGFANTPSPASSMIQSGSAIAGSARSACVDPLQRVCPGLRLTTPAASSPPPGPTRCRARSGWGRRWSATGASIAARRAVPRHRATQPVNGSGRAAPRRRPASTASVTRGPSGSRRDPRRPTGGVAGDPAAGVDADRGLLPRRESRVRQAPPRWRPTGSSRATRGTGCGRRSRRRCLRRPPRDPPRAGSRCQWGPARRRWHRAARRSRARRARGRPRPSRGPRRCSTRCRRRRAAGDLHVAGDVDRTGHRVDAGHLGEGRRMGREQVLDASTGRAPRSSRGTSRSMTSASRSVASRRELGPDDRRQDHAVHVVARHAPGLGERARRRDRRHRGRMRTGSRDGQTRRGCGAGCAARAAVDESGAVDGDRADVHRGVAEEHVHGEQVVHAHVGRDDDRARLALPAPRRRARAPRRDGGGGQGGRDDRDRCEGGEVTDGSVHGRSVAQARYGTVTCAAPPTWGTNRPVPLDRVGGCPIRRSRVP